MGCKRSTLKRPLQSSSSATPSATPSATSSATPSAAPPATPSASNSSSHPRKQARIRKLNLGFPAPADSDQLYRLCEKLDKENIERFRSEYGFDLVTEKPVPGSKWKWSKV